MGELVFSSLRADFVAFGLDLRLGEILHDR